MREKMTYRMIGLLLMAMALTAVVACSTDDSGIATGEESGHAVDLAFNVSVERGQTRTLDNIAQAGNTFTYRELQDVYLFPFDVQDTIRLDQTPLWASVSIPNRYSSSVYHYYRSNGMELPDNAASFLCYARAVPTGNEFRNGVLLDAIGVKPNTSDISFTPKIICENSVPTQKAIDIAAYLTAIANKLKTDGKDDLFHLFVNEGRMVPCSYANVVSMVDTLRKENISVENSGKDLSGYPEDLSLPDGVAAVKWDYVNNRFEPQTVTTTEANVNRLDRFIYPIELWYYANSRIKTSTESKRDFFSRKNWADVLREYETDNGVMHAGVHSVVIKDPLSYAVGCMRIGLTAASTLEDADGNTITLGEGTFPLTATLVSGQYKQAFNFTPMNDVSEYIVYDNQMEEISLGAARTASPSTATPTKWSHTLVLQSKDGASVRFALEFKNNSGQAFRSLNGTVYKDTKFYLVGSIDVPHGQTEDYKRRAFTKGYYTQGTVRISSLQQAYPYLPDLLDPRLEIGIRLVPDWTQATSTSVPL